MADWTASMQRLYEYYIVDPDTWTDVKPLANVKSGNITRDSEVETLGSATIDLTEFVGECYVRKYLVIVQNGIKERYALGTFLIQTPSSTFNGKSSKISVDAYTPLIELKENQPPLGYSLLKGENILDAAYRIIREKARAPVVKPAPLYEQQTDGTLVDKSPTLKNDFVSNTQDTWLSFVRDLLLNADYELDLDETGRILFSPKQELDSLQPVWTYDDGNSSILLPDISIQNDLYDIPNVVEVIYSSGNDCYYARVVNDDPNSPVSTVNRGREITHRVTNPNFAGEATQAQIDEYAVQVLKSVSTVECSVRYTHAYCPVRVGDCVRLVCPKAGLDGVKAKVVSQSIKCTPSCTVSEKAIFTTKLWR